MSAIPNTWSYSRWDTWSTCPLKYKLRFIDKLPDPPSPAMQRGDKFHKAIARHLINDLEPLPAEVKTDFHRQLVGEMRAHRNKLVEQQWGLSRNWIGTGWFGTTTWLRAICDVAMLYDDDSAEVIDWKTGKRYGSNDDQMELFAAVTASKFTLQTKNGVRTTLIYVDSDSEECAEFPARDIPPLIEKWTDRAEKMLADRQWLPRPNDKCKFCKFSRSDGGPCRFG